jgi:hypothetical protein
MKSTNFFSRFLPGHAKRVQADAYEEFRQRRTAEVEALKNATRAAGIRRWDNTLSSTDAIWLKPRGVVPTMDRRAYRGHVPPYPMPAPPAAPSVGVTHEDAYDAAARLIMADLEAVAMRSYSERFASPAPAPEPEESRAFSSGGGGDFGGGGAGSSWSSDSSSNSSSSSDSSSDSSSSSSSD